jgi:heme exporter protein CcmD
MSHQFYLWMAYGATVIAIVVEIVALRVRRSNALRRIEEERELEAQD